MATEEKMQRYLSGFFSSYIWHRNQTYLVASAPAVTGSVFMRDIQIIFGTEQQVINESRCHYWQYFWSEKNNAFDKNSLV